MQAPQSFQCTQVGLNTRLAHYHTILMSGSKLCESRDQGDVTKFIHYWAVLGLCLWRNYLSFFLWFFKKSRPTKVHSSLASIYIQTILNKLVNTTWTQLSWASFVYLHTQFSSSIRVQLYAIAYSKNNLQWKTHTHTSGAPISAPPAPGYGGVPA